MMFLNASDVSFTDFISEGVNGVLQSFFTLFSKFRYLVPMSGNEKRMDPSSTCIYINLMGFKCYLDVVFKVHLLKVHLDTIRMYICIASTKCNYNSSVFVLYSNIIS